jgi:hypothetical protein
MQLRIYSLVFLLLVAFVFSSTPLTTFGAAYQEPVVEPPSEDTSEDDAKQEDDAQQEAGKRELAPQADASDKPATPKSADGPMAKGRVFLDVNNDGKYGEADQPFVNVRVSNGKEIVRTDDMGRWALPFEEEAIFFLVKPSGYQAKLSDENLPQFYYIHKPNGSPKLRFPGSKPTGALPVSIDFPLYPSNEPENFQILLFGDPQPRNNQEVDYIAHDVIAQLIGEDSSTFGVTLGDIAFDNLDTFKTLNQAIAMIGIPWHNVIGNHDINLDGGKRKHINETFEATYGPTWYSFDYGQVHFVVLDNIDWGARDGRSMYVPNFGERQREFLKNDLALIPESQMVVLLMHVPFLDCKDHQEMFRLIENRPFCVSVSAHRHVHTHQFFGENEGWKGDKEHHHIVNVTVSGSWWSGAKNDRGVPHSTMGDGAPNGYSIMSFVDGRYTMDFRGAGIPAQEQMLVQVADSVGAEDKTEFWVNVYNGSSKSKVEYAIDGSNDWQKIEQSKSTDPNYVRIHKLESQVQPPIEPKLTKPKISAHLWKGDLPSGLEPGTHLLRVRTTDMHDRVFYGQRSFRVSK